MTFGMGNLAILGTPRPDLSRCMVLRRSARFRGFVMKMQRKGTTAVVILVAVFAVALVLEPTPGAASGSSQSIQCGPAGTAKPPTPGPAHAGGPCPSGLVPVPSRRSGPKGLPKVSATSITSSAASGGCPYLSYGDYFCYVGAAQWGSSLGSFADFTQPQPAVASGDSHSLAEIAAESSDGQQIVEVGWIVDSSVGTTPHLFAASADTAGRRGRRAIYSGR